MKQIKLDDVTNYYALGNGTVCISFGTAKTKNQNVVSFITISDLDVRHEPGTDLTLVDGLKETNVTLISFNSVESIDRMIYGLNEAKTNINKRQ